MGLLNDLLTHALLPGQTSASENGRGFQINRPNEETILVFRSDNEILSRNHFPNKKCDVIIYYKNRDSKQICYLIEFKGGSVEDGYEQIEETFKILRRADVFTDCEFFGLVITNGSSHIDTKKIQAKYRLVPTEHKTVTGRKNIDIGPILRR